MISLTTKTRRPTGCGKSRAVESEENQEQVFLPSHRPWKSRKTRGIPTFPTAPTAGISQATSGNLIVVDRKECLTPDSLHSAVGRGRLENAELRRPLEPPFHNAPCTNPIQFSAKRSDLLTAVVEFAELRKR